MKKYRFKKKIMVLAAAALTTIAVVACGKKANEGNTTYIDLKAYYGIENGKYGIIIDGDMAGSGIKIGEDYYLPQTVVADKLNNKFYYDSVNKEVLYSTPDEMLTYQIDDEEGNIVQNQGAVYLKLGFVLQHTNITAEIANSPDRIVINTHMQETETYKATEASKLRNGATNKAEILDNISKNQTLYEVIEDVWYSEYAQMDDLGSINQEEDSEWAYVMTSNGVKGYVERKKLTQGEVYMPVNENGYEDAEYTHKSFEGKVALGWHQILNKEDNDGLSDVIKKADNMNVISPTWYALSGKTGEISSYASKSYVKKAKAKGLQVWALVSDFEKDEAGNYYVSDVITNTASRKRLIENLMKQVDKYELDGLNIDFEKINKDTSKAYLQFLRELYLQCRQRDIYLSVDVYVPMSFNLYYDRAAMGEVADYIMVMGYDEHWGGGSEAGSVASIKFVRNGIYNTIKYVESSRVINAIPFYTRVWCESEKEPTDVSSVLVEDSVVGNYYLSSVATGMEYTESLLKKHKVDATWLDDAGQYYGEYEDDGSLYRVWVENEDSIALKLNAMKEAEVGGVACWKLGLEKKEIWQQIGAFLEN